MKRLLPIFFILLILAGCAFLFSPSNEQDTDDGAVQSSLTVFNYGDYIDVDVLDQFEAETGIQIKYEQYVAPEDMYTKYQSGGISYDVICTSDYMVEKMILNQELEPINPEIMENYHYLDPIYLDFCQSFDPANTYAVPYLWGTVGILYNTAMVEEEPESWEVFFDERYKNAIVVQNSMRDAFIIPLKLAGASLNTKDANILRQAKERLFDQKQYTLAYLVDEIRDVMIMGDAAIAEIYSGDATVAMESNEDLAYVLPSEGSNIWLDCWVIPKNATHKKEAQLFLDFLCRPDIAMKNFEYIYYGTPNLGVKEMLDEETLADETIFPSEEALKNCEVYQYLGEETDQAYTQMWKEIKSYAP